jgi:hypothetical protein
MENTIEEIDLIANDTNTNPTEKQKEAGNYKMGHIRIKGMPISIENPKGSYRTYKKEDGTEGKVKMKNHYGYFTNTTAQGKDRDAVDVFIGPNVEEFDYVYVIDQNNTKGEFDESKVMLGFNSKEHAKNAYLSNYSSDWDGFRSITKVSIRTFKKWLYRNHKQNKPFSEYYVIQKQKLDESFNFNENIVDDENGVTNQIINAGYPELAEEIADAINKKGVYAFTDNNLVFASIEEDNEDISYYDKTVESCKKLAYDIMIEKGFNPDMYN